MSDTYHPHKVGDETPEQTRDRLERRLTDRRDQLELAKKHWAADDERWGDLNAQLDEARRDLNTFDNPPPPDGFRPRRVREKGWKKSLMESGVIRDPSKPEPPRAARKPGDIVIDVPIAKGDAGSHSPG